MKMLRLAPVLIATLLLAADPALAGNIPGDKPPMVIENNRGGELLLPLAAVVA